MAGADKIQKSLQELGEGVMDLVTRVAGRRLWQTLEFVHSDIIKPLEDENARLRAILAKHGIEE